MNYKITIMYDGSRYKGWQNLKSTDQTIQGKLQELLQRQVGYPVEVIGSGRTDAGVHAIGQVANFHLKEDYSCEEIKRMFDTYLPEDIAVTRVEKVGARFHSRFSATKKCYRYRIHTAPASNVFERKFVYHLIEDLNVEAMKEAAGYLVGEHDFMSFCNNKKMKKSTIRRIDSITIDTKENGEIVIDYVGNGFLQNMVRILTGTLIEVGRGERSAESMSRLLEAKNRELAGYTVPPQGLCLLWVNYEE